MQKNWRELIKPKRLEVDYKGQPGTYGKFECEPLERGFGITLGNAPGAFSFLRCRVQPSPV